MYVSLCTDLLLISREIKLSVLFLDASLITNLLFMMSSHTVQVVPDICLFSVTYQCIYSCDVWHHIPYLIGTKSTFSWLLSSVQPLLGICALRIKGSLPKQRNWKVSKFNFTVFNPLETPNSTNGCCTGLLFLTASLQSPQTKTFSYYYIPFVSYMNHSINKEVRPSITDPLAFHPSVWYTKHASLPTMINVTITFQNSSSGMANSLYLHSTVVRCSGLV